MKSIHLALLSFATLVGSLVASAQQATATAYVSSVDGSATYLAPGSNEAKAVVIGQPLPEGSVITTDASSSLIIVSHEGIQTGLGPKSTAAIGTHSVSADGVRTAVIDLKLGTTVSVLDPTKRASNNYAIRTPKGVAAARGTTYSTSVTLSSGGEAIVTVNTVTGEVSFSIISAGGSAPRTISVSEGNSANSSSTVSATIADALTTASSPTAQADMVEALNATVAVVSMIANASTGSADAGNANKTLNTVVANVTKVANEVANNGGAANVATATALVSQTVTTVRELAGDGASAAVTTITTTSTNTEVKDAAAKAETAPVTVKTVTVAPAGEASPQTISAPANNTQTTPTDITIITIISPSSTKQQ
jgi:hypothetical protein